MLNERPVCAFPEWAMPKKPSQLVLPPCPALAELSPMLLAERKTAPADEGAYLVEIKYDG